jgi:tetratricopeptide (TPR) repeat protein
MGKKIAMLPARWILLVVLAVVGAGTLAGCMTGEAIAAYNRGNEHFQNEDYSNAVYEYSKAIVANPEFVRAYNNRGVAFSRREKYDKAIKDFNKVLALDPEYASAYNNRGFAYYKQGKTEEAIADFEKTLELSDDPALREQAEEALANIQK